jgi:hypothetical protein
LRLTQVKSSLFLEEFNNKDAHEEEEFLRSFDISEEVKWAKMFVQSFEPLVTPVKTFMCFMEPWEDPTGKALAEIKNRVTKFKLADKYEGISLYDDDEDEHRRIVSVDWVNRKGYQVITQLVGSEDDTDENMGYLINEELPPLIKLGTNPGLKMLESAAEAAAWGATGPATAARGPSAAASPAAASPAAASPAAASPAADDDRADADMLEGARRASAENVPLRAGEPWQAEGRR